MSDERYRSQRPPGLPAEYDAETEEWEDAPAPARRRTPSSSTSPEQTVTHYGNASGSRQSRSYQQEEIPELSRNLGDPSVSPERSAARRQTPPVQSNPAYPQPVADNYQPLSEYTGEVELGATGSRYATDAVPAAKGTRRRQSTGRPAAGSRGTQVSPGVSLSVPSVGDRVAVGALLLAAVGLMFMVVTLASQVGNLDDWIPFKLDASGDVSEWATREALWRIPFGVFVMTLMSAILAFFVARKDAFAARIVALSAIMVQIIAWIGLVDQLT